MKIIVNPHKLEIQKDLVNEKEIDITKCYFQFDDQITDQYVKEAYFTFENQTYKQIILNDQCDIPYEVLRKKGQVEIGVVAFLTENEQEIKRYNPSPAYFDTMLGSLKDQFENSEPVTPTDKEQMEQMLNNIDIQAEKVDNKTTITITNTDGSQQSVDIYDGEVGELDEVPTEDSDNAVKSKGIKSYVDNLVGDIETVLTTLDIGGGV